MAGLLGVIAWLPQLHRVMIQRLHEGISMPTLLTICLALVLWIIYGFLIDSMAIIGSNIAAGHVYLWLQHESHNLDVLSINQSKLLGRINSTRDQVPFSCHNVSSTVLSSSATDPEGKDIEEPESQSTIISHPGL